MKKIKKMIGKEEEEEEKRKRRRKRGRGKDEEKKIRGKWILGKRGEVLKS